MEENHRYRILLGSKNPEVELEKSPAGKTPFFYGWVIVAIAFVSTGVWSGMRTTFSVFLVVLLDQFPWSRAAIAGVQSLSFIVYTFTAPLVGGLLDRFGPRRVILPGIVLLSGGLILCASLQNLLQFYLFYGVIVAFGVTFVSIVPYSTILSNWFEKRRGLANGIAVSGMGLGTFLLVPLTQYVAGTAGWRVAFVVLGGLVFLLLFPISALYLRHRPADVGLEADGKESEKGKKKKELVVLDPAWAATRWTLKRAAREWRFWSMLIFAFLVIIPIYLLVTHGMRILADHGFDRMTAAFMVAVIGMIGSVFRIFWGWLSDRIGREITYTMGATLIALAALFLLLLESGGNRMYAYLFVFCFGSGWGVTAPTFMSVSADLFQGRTFGMIYGVTEATIGFGSAIGPWVGGFIFDRTGSYYLAFLLAIAVSLLSCLFIWLAAPRKVRRVRSVMREQIYDS